MSFFSHLCNLCRFSLCRCVVICVYVVVCVDVGVSLVYRGCVIVFVTYMFVNYKERHKRHKRNLIKLFVSMGFFVGGWGLFHLRHLLHMALFVSMYVVICVTYAVCVTYVIVCVDVGVSLYVIICLQPPLTQHILMFVGGDGGGCFSLALFTSLCRNMSLT